MLKGEQIKIYKSLREGDLIEWQEFLYWQAGIVVKDPKTHQLLVRNTMGKLFPLSDLIYAMSLKKI